MKKLQIDEKEALNLYKDASKEFKIILENTFGKEYFNRKITDIVYDVDSLLKYLDLTLNDIIPYPKAKTKVEKSLNAQAIIYKVTEIYNEETILDWNNTNQYKYLPYFNKVGSAWVAGSCTSGWCTADCSCGLYYKDSNLALLGANNFIEVYNDLLG